MNRAFVNILTIALLFLTAATIKAQLNLPQSVVATTGDASRQTVIFSDPVNAPTSQNLTTGLPTNAVPRALAFFGNDDALVGDFGNSRIFVIKLSTASVVSTISTSSIYGGQGTIVVSPQRDYALAMDGGNRLNVIRAPFNSSSPITSVTMPGTFNQFQTQSIIFDNAGRAFVRTTAGISVLDAPYTSISFTIARTLTEVGGLALTPDGNTLLVTTQLAIGASIFVFNAPYSAASTSQTISSNTGLSSIAISPDGTKAIYLVNTPFVHIARTLNAPFATGASGETLPLPAGSQGYGEISFNTDGTMAILGNSTGANPPALLKAPFTAAGAQVSLLPVNGTNPGNGSGAARFLPVFSQTQPTRSLFDFDGDGKADPSVFRPTDTNWYLSRSSNNQLSVTQFGVSTDKLTPADYDGDSKTDIAVWRENASDPNLSYFYILQSANNTVKIEQFGSLNDKPSFSGDWDGDGKADVSVYRPSNNTFYYRPSATPATSFVGINWGIANDVPMRGDFDGDGKSDAAVFRPSNGDWYIRQSSNNQLRVDNWGISTDKFVSADYDGDAKTDLAVFRNGVWYIKQSTNNQLRTENFGIATDTPVAADYDGDGKADIAVFRNGTWYLNRSTGGFAAISFGN
ncbi:MAG TPA: VCBS repeat-containing protein, partial [Pyrinomonadaceae bacterium]|nr:VCBS repeat-containing protein [Pyrinomonadaceae bacterium]